MEYRTQIISPPPTSAVTFFERLNKAGVRYGIFKSSRNTVAALAGHQDLDILVARKDYHRFCAIASECAGLRSVNHPSLVSPAREDWFIPDFERARYLHLDVHTSVRLGGKFNKRYPCHAYCDVRHWSAVNFSGCSIPIASPMDESAVMLSRIAFRSKGKVSGLWQRLTGDWAQELDGLLFATVGTEEKCIRRERAGLRFQCRVRKHGNEIWVHRGDLSSIRRSVRAHCGSPMYSAFTDSIRNALRTWRYTASRILGRIFPGITMDRRRPASGGLIVAVIAPDGMGKTTQVKRMSKLFSWKFSCAANYLGTGEGEGWRIRRLIRASYMQRRAKIRASLLSVEQTEDASRTFKGRVGAFLLAAWGIIVALERYASIRKARRMADRGFIVLCDRWPQDIQPGLMDGPTRSLGDGSPGWLRKWELSLYRRMAESQPDLFVQLVGSYATSEARKPGEITREEFDKRMALMEELRERYPGTCVLDADVDVDAVSRSLFRLIWSAL